MIIKGYTKFYSPSFKNTACYEFPEGFIRGSIRRGLKHCRDQVIFSTKGDNEVLQIKNPKKIAQIERLFELSGIVLSKFVQKISENK